MHNILAIKKGTSAKWIGYWMHWYRIHQIVLKRWQKGKNGREWTRDWMILEWRWIEWNGCDRVIDEGEMIIENVNMSDSKRELYWELNSD